MTLKAKNIDWRKYERETSRIAIIPIGSCEQHGYHLPLGTDTIIAAEIAERVAHQVDGIVFPTIPFGARSAPFSGGGPTFPGTIDISSHALCALMADLLREIIADGFNKILIVSAHFENQAPILEAMHSLNATTPKNNADSSAALADTPVILLTNWWDGIEMDLGPSFKSWDLEHAALTETSLMLAIAPELVHLEHAFPVKDFVPPPYFRFPLSRGDIPTSGALSSADGATAELGEKIAEAAVKNIVNACRVEFDGDKYSS